MARCRVDTTIERVEMDGFSFPLGVYPVEKLKPRAGYTLAFEPADGDEGPGSTEHEDHGDDIVPGPGRLGGAGGGGGTGAGPEWEEWPDRYVFDILVPSNRLEALVRALFAMFPGRVYPILDVLGHDEYREVDPYVSYDLLGIDRYIDAIRRYRGFFYEDGLVGFGAMSDQPFLYIFVDEHKIVTVRAEAPLRERVEQTLSAFDLEQVNEIAGADSVTHEHRSVLDAPQDRLDLLTADEIVEELQEEWRLELNVNPESNTDEEGNELGITGWRCIVRLDPIPPEPAATENPAEKLASKAGKALADETEDDNAGDEKPDWRTSPTPTLLPPSRYAEVLLTADCLSVAQDLAIQSVINLPTPKKKGDALKEGDEEPFIVVLSADRLQPENFAQAVQEITRQKPEIGESKVHHAAWIT